MPAETNGYVFRIPITYIPEYVPAPQQTVQVENKSDEM
jgi:hypothetical protein